MRILRLIQLTGLLISLGAFLTIGHQYYTAMSAPEGNAARFVASTGEEVARPSQGTPTFVESTKAFLAGLLGQDKKKNPNSLAALHTRSNIKALSYDQQATREMDFWMNFTSKLGFAGP